MSVVQSTSNGGCRVASSRLDVAGQASGKIVRRPAMRYRRKKPRSLSRSSSEIQAAGSPAADCVPGGEAFDPRTHQRGFAVAGPRADQRQRSL